MRVHFETLPPVHGHHVNFRIGINSGPVVGGVIGTYKFQYDIWGDTVNTAARMESHGVPGRIHISHATRELIKDDFVCDHRGTIEVKGKGQMDTWFVRGRLRGSRPRSYELLVRWPVAAEHWRECIRDLADRGTGDQRILHRVEDIL